MEERIQKLLEEVKVYLARDKKRPGGVPAQIRQQKGRDKRAFRSVKKGISRTEEKCRESLK